MLVGFAKLRSALGGRRLAPEGATNEHHDMVGDASSFCTLVWL